MESGMVARIRIIASAVWVWVVGVAWMHRWHYRNPFDRECSVCGRHEVEHFRTTTSRSYYEVFDYGVVEAHYLKTHKVEAVIGTTYEVTHRSWGVFTGKLSDVKHGILTFTDCVFTAGRDTIFNGGSTKVHQAFCKLRVPTPQL